MAHASQLLRGLMQERQAFGETLLGLCVAHTRQVQK